MRSHTQRKILKRIITQFSRIFIYLLYEHLLPPWRDQHAPKPRKERRRKERGSEKMEEKKDRGKEGETTHPNPGNGCAHRR